MLFDMKLPSALTELEPFEVELFPNILDAGEESLSYLLDEAAEILSRRNAPVDVGHWLSILRKVDPILLFHSALKAPLPSSSSTLISVLKFLNTLFTFGFNKRYFLSLEVDFNLLNSNLFD